MSERGLIVNDPASWARVRAEAAAEQSAALKALEGTVLESGAPIVRSLARDYGDRYLAIGQPWRYPEMSAPSAGGRQP